MAVRKTKSYKCTICGAEVPDMPMPVLKHQLSHVRRRPRADHRPAEPKGTRDEADQHDADQP